jgi:hypothetical protein
MITELLISALMMVESSGGLDKRDGDGGRAIGPLQIHAVVVADVNRIAGTSYTHEQARQPAVARRICVIYLNHYATPARIGRAVTDEHRARIWNGGPRGWQKPATLKYWTKVRRHLPR